MQKSRFADCTIKKKRFSKFRWGEPHSEYRGSAGFIPLFTGKFTCH